MRDVHARAAHVTPFGRLGQDLAGLARRAVRPIREHLDDPGGLDHLLVAVQSPEELGRIANTATQIASALGLAPVPATRVETGPSSGGSAVELGARLVGSGAADDVLVLGVETMTTVPTPRASRVLARMIDPLERRYGLTMPALAALTTRRYLRDHDLTREELALAPVKAHDLASRNPRAHLGKPVTVEDVLASPPVADPLTLYDCAPLSDGAAALLLTAREGPLRFRGAGHATDLASLADRRGPLALTSFPATRRAAEAAYNEAELRPGDVDLVEAHDAFSILEIMNLVDLGLAPPGEAVEMLRDGDTRPDGSLPVNPGGGLKATGHPVGATGVRQVAELLEQATGEAPGATVPDWSVGLAHNIGGYGNNVVVTLWEALA